MEKLNRFASTVQKILKSAQELRQFVDKLTNFFNNFKQFQKKGGVIVEMLKAYGKGTFPIPKGTVAIIIGTGLYIISPFDAIPDCIPIIGFTDDLALLKLSLDSMKSTLIQFQKYQDARNFKDQTEKNEENKQIQESRVAEHREQEQKPQTNGNSKINSIITKFQKYQDARNLKDQTEKNEENKQIQAYCQPSHRLAKKNIFIFFIFFFSIILVCPGAFNQTKQFFNERLQQKYDQENKENSDEQTFNEEQQYRANHNYNEEVQYFSAEIQSKKQPEWLVGTWENENKFLIIHEKKFSMSENCYRKLFKGDPTKLENDLISHFQYGGDIGDIGDIGDNAKLVRNSETQEVFLLVNQEKWRISASSFQKLGLDYDKITIIASTYLQYLKLAKQI